MTIRGKGRVTEGGGELDHVMEVGLSRQCVKESGAGGHHTRRMIGLG